MRHPPDTGSHPHGIDVARIAASQLQERPSGVVLRRPKRSAARFRKGVVVGSGNPLGKERSRKWNFLVTCITEGPMKTSRFTDSQIEDVVLRRFRDIFTFREYRKIRWTHCPSSPSKAACFQAG